MLRAMLNTHQLVRVFLEVQTFAFKYPFSLQITLVRYFLLSSFWTIIFHRTANLHRP